jgi:hypothetical protein
MNIYIVTWIIFLLSFFMAGNCNVWALTVIAMNVRLVTFFWVLIVVGFFLKCLCDKGYTSKPVPKLVVIIVFC